jgi:hypothetical protein
MGLRTLLRGLGFEGLAFRAWLFQTGLLKTSLAEELARSKIPRAAAGLRAAKARRLMRWTASGAGLAIMIAATLAATDTKAGHDPATRVADATTDTCLARCADTSAACKRVCPSTFGTPCQASCDSQYQMCRQSCQNR